MKTSCRAALATILILALFGLSGCKRNVAQTKDADPETAGLSAEELVRKGDEALVKKEDERAVLFYLKSLDKGADKASVNLKLGALFLARQRWGQALTAYRTAINADNSLVPALYGAGYAAFMIEDFPASEAYLKKALEHSPSSAPTLGLLGVVYNKADKPEEAVEAFKRQAAAAPNDPEPLNNMGVSYFMLGRYDEAAQALTSALALQKTPRTFNNLGLALCKLGRYDDALAAFTAGASEAVAYNNVGACHERAGDLAKARQFYEKAVERNTRFYVKASANLSRLNSGQAEIAPPAAAVATPAASGK